MEQAGVRIDKAVLDALSKRFSSEMERVGERIFELAGRASTSTRPSNLAKCSLSISACPARKPRKEQGHLHCAGRA